MKKLDSKALHFQRRPKGEQGMCQPFGEFLGTTGASSARAVRKGDAKWRLPMPILALLVFAFFAVTENVSAETLEVVRQIPHSGYSEGLDYHDGFLWQAQPQAILKIDPKDGAVVSRFPPATDYSESLVWVKGTLWNVSFSDNGIYSATASKNTLQFSKKGTVPEIHAWGLAFDGKSLVVTGDFSKKLYFLDPSSLKLTKTLTTDQKDLEDLAWDGKGFWASSFTTHRGSVFRVDAVTGKSSPAFSLPDKESCPVIDGIAWDGKGLWITGKHCPSIYYVKPPNDRALSQNAKSK